MADLSSTWLGKEIYLIAFKDTNHAILSLYVGETNNMERRMGQHFDVNSTGTVARIMSNESLIDRTATSICVVDIKQTSKNLHSVNEIESIVTKELAHYVEFPTRVYGGRWCTDAKHDLWKTIAHDKGYCQRCGQLFSMRLHSCRHKTQLWHRSHARTAAPPGGLKLEGFEASCSHVIGFREFRPGVPLSMSEDDAMGRHPQDLSRNSVPNASPGNTTQSLAHVDDDKEFHCSLAAEELPLIALSNATGIDEVSAKSITTPSSPQQSPNVKPSGGNSKADTNPDIISTMPHCHWHSLLQDRVLGLQHLPTAKYSRRVSALHRRMQEPFCKMVQTLPRNLYRAIRRQELDLKNRKTTTTTSRSLKRSVRQKRLTCLLKVGRSLKRAVQYPLIKNLEQLLLHYEAYRALVPLRVQT